MIVPNGKGVSLYTSDGVFCKNLSDFAWQSKKSISVEPGLRLIPDRDPGKKGHYQLCPTEQKPIDVYKKLLEKMELKCHKYLKIMEDGRLMVVAWE